MEWKLHSLHGILRDVERIQSEINKKRLRKERERARERESEREIEKR